MKKRTLLPLTFEVRKKLQEIEKTLPQMPVIKYGQVIVHKQVTLVKGQDLINDGVTELADKHVINDKRYHKISKQIQYINHGVELRKIYQYLGFNGIDKYVKMCNDFKIRLDELSKKDNGKY